MHRFRFILQSKITWFNIGSVEALERNLENAQADMDTEAANFIPIIYKDEAGYVSQHAKRTLYKTQIIQD